MGLEYDSSLMADDDCYSLLVDGEDTGVVEVPVEWLRDDAVYLLFNREPATRPWMTPDAVYEVFRRELEGAARDGGLFQLVMHPFVIGYRSRLWILEKLIEDARALGSAVLRHPPRHRALGARGGLTPGFLHDGADVRVIPRQLPAQQGYGNHAGVVEVVEETPQGEVRRLPARCDRR
jgi:hypothetical protein